MSNPNNFRDFDKRLRSHFSSGNSTTTPITELNPAQLSHITNFVYKKCREIGISPPKKIFGFENGCPVCFNTYSSDNWIVLHPCGHLICEECLRTLNLNVGIDGTERKCVLCRRRCKWIGRNDDNLKSTTTPSPSSPRIRLPPNPFQNYQNYNANNINLFPRLNQQLEANYPFYEFLPSRPPIELDERKDERKEERKEENRKIRLEISWGNDLILEGQNRKIGNLSIVSPDLENQTGGTGIDLVIVMDVSGSMSSVSNDCINILKHSLGIVSKEDRLCILTFDSSAKQLFPLQPITHLVRDECLRKIQNCFTGGSTNLKDALSLLIKVKNDGFIRERPFKIILLSDGQPDQGSEGFELVAGIYEGEIKPEVYACTFGSGVKADTLKKVLLPQNEHYYHHIPDTTSFKELVNRIGLDKNIIRGKNLEISFKNISPIVGDEMNLIKRVENNNDLFTLNLNQIKSGETITLPLLQLRENFHIQGQYTNLEEGIILLENNLIQNERMSDFITFHFWYRKLVGELRDITKINGRESQLSKLREIESDIIPEKLGDFIQEVKELFKNTLEMINNHSQYNHHHYNTYTSTVYRASSHTSPTVHTVYQTYSTPDIS